MDFRLIFLCCVSVAIAAAYSMDDPWMRDPMFFNLWQLTQATNHFAFNLFNQMTTERHKNFLICPVSLATSFGILYQGSRGETEKELEDLLGYSLVNLTKSDVAQSFYLLTTKILVSSKTNFYLFDAPSTILVNKYNGVLPTFQRKVEVLYQTPITVVDLVESAEVVAKSINEWVAARTRYRIRHVIEEIDPFVDLIIINAAYFKGSWLYMFSPEDTNFEPFHNYGIPTEQQMVPMMHMTNMLNYHENKQRKILELPFRGRNVSMVIILPNQPEGLGTLENTLNPYTFDKDLSKLEPTDVAVSLPQFKFHYSTDMVETLKGMGVKKLFKPDAVDLSGMIHRKSPLFGEIRHKTMVGVNEGGLEAAAVSTILTFKSFPIKGNHTATFNVDHPFVFFIYDRRTGMVLFLGRIEEM